MGERFPEDSLALLASGGLEHSLARKFMEEFESKYQYTDRRVLGIVKGSFRREGMQLL